MERTISYAEAICEATDQEMARDNSVFVMGLNVDDFKAIWGTTRGLVERYGPTRVFDTPLSEDAMTGVAVGAALAGLRPIHVHIRMDFLMLAMNQLVNMASKAHYMFGGTVSVPMVVRSVIGRSWGQGPQHSQGLHSLFMHVPGLKVVAPSTAYDAKGCMIEGIRDNNPVMMVEHRWLHFTHSHVPEELYTVPFGKARRMTEGKDITLVGISYMAVECMRAQMLLKQVGIEAEVIDPISLVPLDMDTILASVKKTGHLIVSDTAWTMVGASAEIVARVAEAQDGKAVKMERIGFAPVTCPTSKALEGDFYPDAVKIAQSAYRMLTGKTDWTPKPDDRIKTLEFKGPF